MLKSSTKYRLPGGALDFRGAARELPDVPPRSHFFLETSVAGHPAEKPFFSRDERGGPCRACRGSRPLKLWRGCRSATV